MHSLMNNQYVPLTHQIGFLRADFERVIETYLKWQRDLGRALLPTHLSAELNEALALLQPLTTPSNKDLFISTKSDWVAYFNNGLRASDPETPIGHLCTIIPSPGIVVHCVPDRSSTADVRAIRKYGAVSFTMFGPSRQEWLNQVRYVAVMNDGGQWKFFNEGKVQPFEELEMYTGSRIEQRFTSDMLARYCAAVGIRLFDEEFYGKKGLLTEIPGQLTSKSSIMSLEEARMYSLL